MTDPVVEAKPIQHRIRIPEDQATITQIKRMRAEFGNVAGRWETPDDIFIGLVDVLLALLIEETLRNELSFDEYADHAVVELLQRDIVADADDNPRIVIQAWNQVCQYSLVEPLAA